MRTLKGPEYCFHLLFMGFKWQNWVTKGTFSVWLVDLIYVGFFLTIIYLNLIICCLSYCSVDMRRHHDQGNSFFKKKARLLFQRVSPWSSWQEARLQEDLVIGEVAESPHPFPNLHREKEQGRWLGQGRSFEVSKPTPPPVTHIPLITSKEFH